MARFITCHRRGKTEQWNNFSGKIYDGEIILEESDDGYTRLKVGKGGKSFSELPYISIPGYALVAKRVNIELPATNWEGSVSPYSQMVDIDGITPNSKIDLQATPEQLAWLQDQEISFVVKNEDGNSVVVYAIGDKPTEDFTAQSDLGAIQCTISEITDK